MNTNLNKQYDKNAHEFDELYTTHNTYKSRNDFFAMIDDTIISDIKNKNVLDLGCGPGEDAVFYTGKGLTYYGLDASDEMCKICQKNQSVFEIRNESFSDIVSYGDKQFGLIVSKYAIQTEVEISPIYDQVYRMLDDQGYFVFLFVHPFRQFIEKKKQGKDYYKKEFVESIIFDGKIVVTEPSHTLSEYINKNFLSKFELIDICEGSDFPESEQVNGDIYPTYLILVAQKK